MPLHGYYLIIQMKSWKTLEERFKYMNTKRKKTLAGANLVLFEIEPLTQNQVRAFESEKHLVLHGLAGTGKTFISSYLAFDDMAKGVYEKFIIIRSAVPTRDMGFLPGSDKEKSAVYEEPYKDIANQLFQRGDAYEILKNKHIVHFMTTSFIRGITLRNAVILVDECQNMSFHELDSIITRVGENCRIIFCGDFRQSDLKFNGIKEFLRVLKVMDEFDLIDFEIKDIVRSDFVKKYIIAKTDLGF
jgi:phosphate starvation-inducible protein PhoH